MTSIFGYTILITKDSKSHRVMGSLRILPATSHILAHHHLICSSIPWSPLISGSHVQKVTILSFPPMTKISSFPIITCSLELKSKVTTSTDWEKGSPAISEWGMGSGLCLIRIILSKLIREMASRHTDIILITSIETRTISSTSHISEVRMQWTSLRKPLIVKHS